MTKQKFQRIHGLIKSDIEREIRLAEINSHNELALPSVPAGGGNFLAALGLLCYTEFAGKVEFNYKRKARKRIVDFASKNFNESFDLLGPDYSAFRKSHDVYSIFRCGLAHEYHVKGDCIIYMSGINAPGIGQHDHNGHYFIVVDAYWRDLDRRLTAVANQLQ